MLIEGDKKSSWERVDSPEPPEDLQNKNNEPIEYSYADMRYLQNMTPAATDASRPEIDDPEAAEYSYAYMQQWRLQLIAKDKQK